MKRVEEGHAFLLEASGILASSLDYETTLASVARLSVPFLGDWCAIDILDEAGVIKRVAVVHTDPAKVELAQRLLEEYPGDQSEDAGVYYILRTGEPQFYPEITEDLLVASIKDPVLLEIIRHLGLSSSISVPLAALGRTLGVLSLVMAESGRHYTPQDLALAVEVGRRAGIAVDNARLYSESKRVQEELRKANEAKDEFLSMVSHELRTPITTIYGGSRLLSTQGGLLDEESKASILKDIEQEAERLHRIVEDLLILARVELGQEVQLEPVLVRRIAEKSASALSRRRPNRSIMMDFDETLPPAAGSAGYLEQILRNLLNNADKYAPPGTPIDLVTFLNQDAEIEFVVLDRGPGIPPEEIDRIFERFYRSDSTARQAGGAGIGLSVCKRLVEAQSGRIWACARAGGGLEMHFALPTYQD